MAKSLASICRLVLVLLVGMGALGPIRSARALVINEIMYHSSELDDRPHEWIELYNENLDPLDLSGFRFCNGIEYTFPEGTFLDGFSFLVIASNPDTFRAKYGNGIDVIGGWVGSLDNGGETIELCNPAGVAVLEVEYNDRGDWPGAADGTGHSLALIDPYTDPGDADNWTHSLEQRGTPGAWNGLSLETSAGPPPQEGMDGSGFLLDWLVLGPYLGSDCNLGVTTLRSDWLRGTTSPVETDLVWRNGQLVNTNYSLARATGLHQNASGTTPRVERYRGFSNTINFNDSVWPPNPDNVMAYAFTYVDNVTGESLPVTIGCASDDAIAVLVNGAYVHVNDACRGAGGEGEVQDRANAVLTPGKNLITVKVFEAGGGWAFRLRIEERGNGVPITETSRIQVTTDVDAGLGFDGSGTPIHDPSPGPGGGPGTPGSRIPVVVNEAFFLGPGERWIELYNAGSSPVDLSGHFLTDDTLILAKHELAPGTTIPAGGYLVFTEAELGLDFSITSGRPRVFVGLVAPDEETVIDGRNFEPVFSGFSEARIPDGDRDFDEAADPTPGAANKLSVEDSIVINEVMYHPIDDDPRKEWIELYNRGSNTVDLTGWAFTNGINFEFPNGTSLAPGAYLVVARDPGWVRTTYGLSSSSVLGPAQDPASLAAFGVFRDRGERITLKDAMGRTADTIRYQEGGEWPKWADGGGSSLELIDPHQDNRFGQAWDASDDSHKAPVQELTYVGRQGTGESELHLALLDDGIAIVDDVSVRSDGLTFEEDDIISEGATWRYFKGTTAPPATWNQVGFADGSWLSGAAGIGYGDGDDATVLSDMQGNYLSVFMRRAFTLSDPEDIDSLILRVSVDDGFVAYLNGTQVASFNMAGTDFDDPATGVVDNFELVERDISSFKDLLVAGTNVLAIQAHNVTVDSTDLSCHPSLVSRTVQAGGGTEHIVNGTFDTNTSRWVIEGTHIRSGRTTRDPITGAGSLKLVATGRGDNKVNRLETDNTGISPPLPRGIDLVISLKARWIVGSRTLLTAGDFHAMAKSHELAVPPNLGTPGRINSVTERLIATQGGNLGPVLTDLEQTPAVPEGGEAVTVRIRVSDSDGIANVRLHHSANSPSASPQAINMTHTGGGWYQAVIPGRPAGTRTVFHITAQDTTGRVGRYPVDIRERTHPLVLDPSQPSLGDQRFIVYRHDTPEPATPYQNYRFWMTALHENELSSRQLHSNDPVPGSFVFGGRKIYHEANARFSGSPWARGGWGGSWRVTMPRGKPLHERIRRFNMENHGSDAKERISHYLISRMNGGATRVPYEDTQVMVRWQVNDRTIATRERTRAPDSDFISLWYPEDDEGDLFEMDDRFYFNDSGSRAGSEDGHLHYPPASRASDGDGENKENYRFFFGRRNKNGGDDYSMLIDFARLMDPGDTGTAAFDAQVFDRVDVDEIVRLLAIRHNTDDWDTWGADRGKNCYFYYRPIEGRWSLLAWDMELTYGNVDSYLIPTSPTQNFAPGGQFPEVTRFLNRPAIKRLYYAALAEMVLGPDAWFSSSYLTPYMERLAQIGMGSTNVGASGGFIDQRASRVRPRIQSVVFPQVRLQISTNGGQNFQVDSLEATLAGSAPAEVATIVVVRNGTDEATYPLDFTGLTTWSMQGIELESGANELDLLGFDTRGNLIDQDSITITSTVVTGPPPSLSGILPSSAPPGATVELRGSGFASGMRVFFGGTESPSVQVTSATVAQVAVPNGAGLVTVTARNPSSNVSNGIPFTYPPTFIRGDANRDGRVDLSDPIRTLLHLFGGTSIDCDEAADSNNDGALDISDGVFLLEFLFRGGPIPAAPFPEPGFDTDGDGLHCDA